MNKLIKSVLSGISVIFLGLGLVACEDLRGSLQVKQNIVVKPGKKDEKKNEKTILPGNYVVSIDLKKSTLMKVTVKVPSASSVKFELTVPAGIPTYNGAFLTKAGENGQKFDVAGEVKTSDTRSNTERHIRTCSYPVTERECHNESFETCHVNSHGHTICRIISRPVCRTYTRYLSGNEVYEGYTAFHDQYMNANLLEPSTGALLATLESGDHESQFIETWRSGCSLGAP